MVFGLAVRADLSQLHAQDILDEHVHKPHSRHSSGLEWGGS